MFAVLSVWIALGALITTVIVILRPDPTADGVVTLLMYTIALSGTFAAGVLWALRSRPADDAGVSGQRTQAITALGIDSVTFAVILFALLEPRYAVAALAIEYGFLVLCWFLYTRVLLRKPG